MVTHASFHIVVTDINHHIRNFLQRELEKEGYTVSGVKTGIMACERVSRADPLDLIILDPEVFHCFDQTLIDSMIHQHSSLQIIIHTYADSIVDIQPGKTIHLVEKSGQSIRSLKTIIRTCFELFQEKERC